MYFAYSNSLGIARKYVDGGDLPALIGVWPVHLAVLTLTCWLLLSEATRRDVWLRLRSRFVKDRESPEAGGP